MVCQLFNKYVNEYLLNMLSLLTYHIWPKECGHLTITPICAHSQTMGINMDLVLTLMQ